MTPPRKHKSELPTCVKTPYMSRLVHFTYSCASRCSPNQAQQRFWLQRVRGQCFHISDVNELSDAQHHSSQHVNTFNHTLLAFWNSGAINSYPKSMTIPFIMNKVFINKHLFPYFPYFEGENQQYEKRKGKLTQISITLGSHLEWHFFLECCSLMIPSLSDDVFLQGFFNILPLHWRSPQINTTQEKG